MEWLAHITAAKDMDDKEPGYDALAGLFATAGARCKVCFWWSACPKLEHSKCSLDAPHDPGFSGRGHCRFFCKSHQSFDAKAGCQTLETPRRQLPVGVAAGAAQQVGLPIRTFEECAAQIRNEGNIITYGRGQRRFQCSGVIRHTARIRAGLLSFGCNGHFRVGKT